MIFWRALRAVNSRLPMRTRNWVRSAAHQIGVKPPRTSDDVAAEWAAREDAAWVMGYRDSWDRGYRHLFVDRVARFEPVSSVLELGCHSGPNIRLLATRFPDALITGIDVNLPAIEEARRSLAHFPNVTTRHTDLRPELARLEDNGIDCVVSCFALAYVDPDDIDEVLRQAWRVARKGLVLMEPHPGPGQAAEPSGWRRDYGTLLTSAGCRRVSTEPLDPGDRTGGLNAVTIAAK